MMYCLSGWIFRILVLLALMKHSYATAQSSKATRQIWSWVTSHNIEEEVQQLYEQSDLIDGIQVWAGCRFGKNGLLFNETEWNQMQPVLKAARETKTKFQLMIIGAIPAFTSTAADSADPYIKDALDLYQKLGIDGFSIDDEQDCAPRATTFDFEHWMAFHNSFTQGLWEHDVPVTSAVQALFAIEDIDGNLPCQYVPSSYDLDHRVVNALATSTTTQKWLIMDTYYFTTGRFMGALDWHVNYIPLKTLAIGMMNRTDLTEDGLVARFHAIEKSQVNWINIWKMPIADNFLPYLQRWKTHCVGCGKQPILGCYDMTITCDSNRYPVIPHEEPVKQKDFTFS